MKKNYKRIVIKLGTNVLTQDEKNRLDHERISQLCDIFSHVRSLGVELVVVSSGAVTAGLEELNIVKYPEEIHLRQAAASIGQTKLMQLYNSFLKEKGCIGSQILLTESDIHDRERYLNAKYTIETLLEYGVIPILNENDTVATKELKLGDNDSLSSSASALINADLLVILSNVDGLYSGDPNTDKKAKVVPFVNDFSDEIRGMASEGKSQWGLGGMKSKLKAAFKANKKGVDVVILNGKKPEMTREYLSSLLEMGSVSKIDAFAKKSDFGTFFKAQEDKLSSRKHWISLILGSEGELVLDDGAANALVKKNGSLLPSGIVSVAGKFREGDAVTLLNSHGAIIGKGLANYSAQEVNLIKGKHSSQIKDVLGYEYFTEVVHRDNLVLEK